MRQSTLHRLIVVLAGVISAAAATTATAQPAAQPTTVLSDTVELARLLDLAAQRLDLEIQYDPKVLQGVAVTLRMDRGLTDDELWDLTNQLLGLNGFATVQMPGSAILNVVKIQDATANARLEAVVPDGRPAARAGFRTILIEPQHRDAKALIEATRPLVSKPGGSMAELGATGLLLLSDLEPRVDQIVDLLARIDVPADPPLIERVEAENVTASQLAGLINSATNAIGAVTGTPLKGKLVPVTEGNAIIVVAPPEEREQWRSLIERFDRRQPVVRQSYVPPTFAAEDVARLIEDTARDPGPRGSGDQWRVITDDLTGTLIITATPSEHEQIAQVIERLASLPGSAQRPVRAFPIRNRGVREIIDVLSALLEAGVLEYGAGSQSGETAADATRQLQQSRVDVLPPGAEPVEPPERPVAAGGRPQPEAPRTGTRRRSGALGASNEDITLTADEGTNTLIAVGEARRLTQLAELIKTLDVRQPQVMLETLVVVLTDSDSLDLGVELEKLEISGSTLFRLSSLFNLSEGGLNEPTESPGQGGTALILSPGDFRVLIRALETMNRGRALNVPKILVNNNQQASLDSVLQEPFAATNASNTVATTSFSGTQDAGTSVTVTPQIAEGDHLVLEYSVTLSQFVGDSADPSLPPPRQQNTLESVVTIPDGFTVVVGGLETTTETEAENKVPLLGDIPLIGEAFKNRSKGYTRSRFFVFIRPTILRHDRFEDLKYLSGEDVAAAEVDDGWPEVRPRVIK